MELVYLWVKNYKNIHEQGFNFSPKFNCKFHDEYDEDGNLLPNCKLEIIEKKEDEYIKDFFGKNINITAIVGKNGSGKSSVVTFLEKISNNETLENFLLIVEINNQKFCWTNMEVSLDEEIKKYLYPILKKKMKEEDYDFSTNVSDSYDDIHLKVEKANRKYEKDLKEKPTPFKNIFTFTTLLSQDISFYDPKDIANKAIKNSSKDLTFELTTFMMLPKKIILSENQKYKYKLDLEIKKTRENLYPPEISREGELINGYIETLYECSYSEIIHKQMFLQILESEWAKQFIEDSPSLTTPSIKQLKDFYEYCINEGAIDTEYTEEMYQELLKVGSFNISQDNTLSKNIEQYKEFFEFDFIDSRGRHFSDLSHGEKSIYAQFVFMYDVIWDMVYRKDNFLFILDEPDLALHPEWQRKYIDEFIQTFSTKGYIKPNIHLLLTSHSPFILSDLPKRNILFLDIYDDKSKEKYPKLNLKNLEEGNCINVSSEIDINPFGANIHELLSHGFFMEGGLMGEFAKGKITEIKAFYKKVEEEKKTDKNIKFYKEHQKKFWKIQKIIGEPFLQTVIQNYLDEIEIILFKDKAKQLAIQRFINEFGKDAIISEVMSNDKD